MNCLLSFSKQMKWKHFLKSAYDPKNKSKMVLDGQFGGFSLQKAMAEFC